MTKLLRSGSLLAMLAAAGGLGAPLQAQEDYTPLYDHYYLDANGNDVGHYRDTCRRGYIGATATEGMTTSQERTEIWATCDVGSGQIHPF